MPQPTTTAPSTDQYFFMSQTVKSLQDVVSSKTQQINALIQQLQEKDEAHQTLLRETIELRQKCAEYESKGERLYVLRDALMADFRKLKGKMQESNCRRERAEGLLIKNQQEVDKKDQELNSLSGIVESLRRQVESHKQQLSSYRRENSELRQCIQTLKLENLDEKLAFVIQKQERQYQTNKNRNNQKSNQKQKLQPKKENLKEWNGNGKTVKKSLRKYGKLADTSAIINRTLI